MRPQGPPPRRPRALPRRSPVDDPLARFVDQFPIHMRLAEGVGEFLEGELRDPRVPEIDLVVEGDEAGHVGQHLGLVAEHITRLFREDLHRKKIMVADRRRVLGGKGAGVAIEEGADEVGIHGTHEMG